MIYEIALMPVYNEHIERFRQAFAEVVPLLSRAQGYGGHLLAQGIETPGLFYLIVRWRSLADHTTGFEMSEDHRTFMNGLQDYFTEEPRVCHIEGAASAALAHDDLVSALDLGDASAPTDFCL